MSAHRQVPHHAWHAAYSWLLSRPNLPPKQPAEHQIELGGEISLACIRCPGISADDKQATRWQATGARSGHFAQPTAHTVAHHRAPECPGHHETHTRWRRSIAGHRTLRCRLRTPFAIWSYLSAAATARGGSDAISDKKVRGEQLAACAPTSANRQLEILAPPHPRRRR